MSGKIVLEMGKNSMEDKVYLKRKVYDELLYWKNTFKGEYAIMVEGPRRVGKSTIVEEFVKQEYKSYILIDFSRVVIWLICINRCIIRLIINN